MVYSESMQSFTTLKNILTGEVVTDGSRQVDEGGS